MRGERSSYPKRDIKREQASTGSSAVKTYKMSPDELEDFRAKNAYVPSINSNGKTEKRGMDLQTKPRVVATIEHQGVKNVAHKVKNGPDKDFVLSRISAGKSISAVERELGMKMNELHYWIRKWDWVGITPGKARAILSGESIDEVIKLEQEKSNLPQSPKIISELEDRIKQLEMQNAEVVATSGKAIEKLMLEIADLVKLDDENQLIINRLSEEKQLLLQTIENATMPQLAGEEVNHPDHYTAGGIEVIDFIVAKLTAEEFAGYCKGNIMKYVARANLKGGLKDLRKLRWYVDRLLDEVKV